MSSSARRSAGAFFLCLLLALSFQARAASSSPNIPLLVDKYAGRYGIPLYIARNLVRIESGGRQDAVSPSGARGVMQLTPATARALGVDINDPEQNIEGGMRYLRQQYDRFGRWDLALAAYHSGPQAVIKDNGVPPRSQAFVRRILGTGAAVASRGSVPRPQLDRGFTWPVEGPVMRGLGSNGQQYHAGLDISAPQGTPIRAARAGKVTVSGWYYEYGYTIILDHGDGVSTLYGHASKLLVSPGEAVEERQDIALVGCTGRCTGPHVHFEVRVSGRAVNPVSPGVAAQPTPSPQKVAIETSRDTDRSRRTVTVTENTTTTTTDTIRNGQVVRRVEETVLTEGELRVEIYREFLLVDGVLKQVEERKRVYLVPDADGGDNR